MCGIVGVFGELTGKHEKAFKDMLILDQLRGRDSTGILSVKRHDPSVVHIAKQVGGPEELFQDKRFDQCFAGQLNVLIGHNRWKTQGAVIRRNAHPFEFDEVAGVHNGTLKNQWKLEEGNTFQVDSEALYNHINMHGARDALRTAVGAIALAWYNKKHETVNLFRNKERPLWLCNDKDRKVVFIASEPWMIEGAMLRNGIDMYDFPYQLGEDYMMSIPVAKGTGVLGKATVSKVEYPKVEMVAQNNTLGVTNKSVGKDDGKDGTNQVSSQLSLVSSNNSSGDQYKADDQVRKDLVGTYGRDLCFEVGVERKTAGGASYRVLFCPTHPAEKFIVYVHSDRTAAILEDSDWVTGDVANYVTAMGVGWRFVISPHTLQACDIEVPKDVVYMDAHGKELSKEAFEEKYPVCSFCNSDIDADNDHKFTKNHDILCDGCIKDPEILDLAGA
jgi:hypothetical protein